jgi:16S rRNA A1518/A1519 N6-dimethyltransferase RsmA/KsgA/DIM1 with predicted DNA glycosylase/AP lyase activity
VSVLTQAYTNPSMSYVIPRTAFTPAPKVDVGVVRFQPVAALHGVSFDQLETVARVVFKEPRKQIQNNLRELATEACSVKEILQSIDINPCVRPQLLSTEQIISIAHVAVARPEVMAGWHATAHNHAQSRSRQDKQDA